MSRLPRSLTVLPGYVVHKIWRSHNREWNIQTDHQKLTYLKFLNDELEKPNQTYENTLHALALMSSHVHEEFHIANQPHFSNQMRRHHCRYGMYFNRENNRRGKVADDRPKTCLVENEHHEMELTFYIHANPVRAGIVADARNYPWTTHNLYAFGKRQPWMKNVQLPNWYLKLGNTPEERQRKYRILFLQYLGQYKRHIDSFFQPFYGSPAWIEERKTLLAEWQFSHKLPGP
jgi:putative transposase